MVIVLSGSKSQGEKLSKEEAECMSNYCFHIHDHLARTPQPVIWWQRLENLGAGLAS